MAARCDPIREWRDGFARGMHSIDFRPAPEVPFHASVVPILHGVRTALSPGFTFRDEELVKDGGGDAFSLVLSRSKNLEVAQRGQEVRLGHGDATLLHVGETGHVGSSEDFEFIVQMVPYAEVAARGACLDGSVTRRLPAQNEALQLLWSSIRSLEKRKLPVSHEACAVIHRHIVDLAALAFSSQACLGESELSAVASARLDAALKQIAAHFHEPGLSAAAVAQRQGISQRYLQRLLEFVGNDVHRARDRAAAAADLRAADRSTRWHRADYRYCVAGRLFRHLAVQPVVPLPLRRYAERGPGPAP